jgi:hypothetical protein
MQPLLLFQIIADSPFLLCLNFAAVFASFAVNLFIVSPLKDMEDGWDQTLPDERITGYTSDELNLWYELIGPEGRQIYIRAATWDFCPIMPSYILLLGAVLVRLARPSRLSENISYLPILTGTCDIIETYYQRLGCTIYPERLSDRDIFLASTACQMKWILLFVTITLIIVLFVKERLITRVSNSNTETTPTTSRKID